MASASGAMCVLGQTSRGGWTGNTHLIKGLLDADCGAHARNRSVINPEEVQMRSEHILHGSNAVQCKQASKQAAYLSPIQPPSSPPKAVAKRNPDMRALAAKLEKPSSWKYNVKKTSAWKGIDPATPCKSKAEYHVWLQSQSRW